MAGRLEWLTARVVEVRKETSAARTIVLEVPAWPGHRAGQHVDLKLTAEDGYSAQRSYSLAAPPAGSIVEITVQRVADGEVSPFLVDDLLIGDELELRGPIGGWFAWNPIWTEPVLLVAGGSGVVPLMAMVRERARVRSRVPFRLIYSVRSPDDVFYAGELQGRVDGVDVTIVHTRTAHSGRPAGRLTAAELAASGWPADFGPRIFVCGPTGFVENIAATLLAQGHSPASVRTERFGPTGG
ncbi:MAG TPA: ferredoxin reductase [Mycobacteriales bacterium]|nr:ferredoxin reductase [Mycobacteriales bacterium]